MTKVCQFTCLWCGCFRLLVWVCNESRPLGSSMSEPSYKPVDFQQESDHIRSRCRELHVVDQRTVVWSLPKRGIRRKARRFGRQLVMPTNRHSRGVPARNTINSVRCAELCILVLFAKPVYRVKCRDPWLGLLSFYALAQILCLDLANAARGCGLSSVQC